MRKISSPAAVCWRGSSVRWPRHPPRGRCWGMCCGALGWAACWRACGMPCALHWGRGPLRCFFRDIAAFAAAAMLVCGFAAGASAGGLARWYMSAALLLGAVCWHWTVQPAVHRCAAAAAACLLGTAACGGENRRPAPQKAPCRRPQPPQRAQKGKKVRKKAKIR